MAITVPRTKLNWRERMYLPAIVAGLAITIKHFKNMLFGRTKITMQYPEEKWDASLPDYYRGAPALVRDEDGRVRCVACQLCEFICPPRAIKIIPRSERMYLPAIVAGLAITIKHFKNMLFGRTKITMQYPEEKWDASLPDYYRGAPALVRDEDGRVRCVACQLCEFICPPRAIKIIPGE